MLFAWLFKLLAFLPVRLVWRMKTVGRENLPKKPFILVCNHTSGMDPCFVNMAMPLRRIYFLTAPRLFECNPVFRWMLRQVGCRPAMGGGLDFRTLEEISSGLRGWELIGFFAEGRIEQGVHGFKPGAVMLSLKTGLPIVPAYIEAGRPLRDRSRIRFGKPLLPEDGAEGTNDVNVLTDRLRDAVIGLSEQ